MKKILIILTAVSALMVFSSPIINIYADTAHTAATVESHDANHSHGEGAESSAHHAPHIDAKNLSLLWAIPFLGILLSIALFPLLAPHIWHHHYGKISLFWWLLFFGAFSVNFGIATGTFYLLE